MKIYDFSQSIFDFQNNKIGDLTIGQVIANAIATASAEEVAGEPLRAVRIAENLYHEGKILLSESDKEFLRNCIIKRPLTAYVQAMAFRIIDSASNMTSDKLKEVFDVLNINPVLQEQFFLILNKKTEETDA